jgi:hypothetical protein
MASTRRLTANLAADVAGYCRHGRGWGRSLADKISVRERTRSGFVAMIVGSGLALGQLAATPAVADDTAARWQVLEPHFRNYRPSGAGPFPVILMVSGCSGFTPSIAPQVYTRAAESWRSKGYVVVFVDYLSACGLPNCRGSGAVNAVEGLPRGFCATAARHRASGARLSRSAPRFRCFRPASPMPSSVPRSSAIMRRPPRRRRARSNNS